MIEKGKIWTYTWIVVALCILLSLTIFLYTGQIVIILFIAPAIIHWILKKRMEGTND